MPIVNRRNFLKGMGAAILWAGPAATLFAEENEDPRFWEETYDEDRYIRDDLFKMKHFDDNHPDVFERLKALGYVKFRYGEKNLLGVRFEPCHISVLS